MDRPVGIVSCVDAWACATRFPILPHTTSRTAHPTRKPFRISTASARCPVRRTLSDNRPIITVPPNKIVTMASLPVTRQILFQRCVAPDGDLSHEAVSVAWMASSCTTPGMYVSFGWRKASYKASVDLAGCPQRYVAESFTDRTISRGRMPSADPPDMTDPLMAAIERLSCSP